MKDRTQITDPLKTIVRPIRRTHRRRHHSRGTRLRNGVVILARAMIATNLNDGATIATIRILILAKALDATMLEVIGQLQTASSARLKVTSHSAQTGLLGSTRAMTRIVVLPRLYEMIATATVLGHHEDLMIEGHQMVASNAVASINAMEEVEVAFADRKSEPLTDSSYINNMTRMPRTC